MHSSLVRKMLKARVYAEEPDRLTITSFRASFRGDNCTHTVEFEASESVDSPESGMWACTCEYFRGRSTCSHVMAAQEMRPTMIRRHHRPRIPALVPLWGRG